LFDSYHVTRLQARKFDVTAVSGDPAAVAKLGCALARDFQRIEARNEELTLLAITRLTYSLAQ
jgi:hypothetical protein